MISATFFTVCFSYISFFFRSYAKSVPKFCHLFTDWLKVCRARRFAGLSQWLIFKSRSKLWVEMCCWQLLSFPTWDTSPNLIEMIYRKPVVAFPKETESENTSHW